MLTKQARQFEQWADDKERLMAIKAKVAAEKQAKLKKNSASLLVLLGTVLTAIACYGFLYNQDSDWSVVLVFGSIVTIYGVISSRD
jgi:hypothetical protein